MIRLVATAASDVSVTDLCIMTVFLQLSWFEVWQCFPHDSRVTAVVTWLYCIVQSKGCYLLGFYHSGVKT